MFIVSEEMLESLICTQCKKYLSVKPVKVYHNRNIKCGRCSGPSDGGVNSLYGLLADDVLFRCVNRFDGCNQLLAYGDVGEHEKICNATRKYDCPVCTSPFEGTGYEVLIHFKENHPDRLLIGKAEFVLSIDYAENRTYLYRKNDLLFFINISFHKNNDELTLNVRYLGARREADIILQAFALFSVDEKIIYKTRKKSCSSEDTLKYFKIALNEEKFPNHVILCKLELFTGPVEKILVLPNMTSSKEPQVRKEPSTSSPNTNQINPNRKTVSEQCEVGSKELKGKMGETLICGVWTDGDRPYFPFTIDGRHYFYGRSVLDGRRFFIREILPTGQMGEITSQGYWKKNYSTVFPLFISGRQYFLCQGCGSDSDVNFGYGFGMHEWFIRELLPGGITGEETDHGKWNLEYKISFQFAINGRYYFFGHVPYRHLGIKNEPNWFIQELLPGGRMGEKTSHGEWTKFCEVVFPFSVHGRHFIYSHCTEDQYWFIHELLPGGKIGAIMSSGLGLKRLKASFPFGSGGRQYFYSQSVDGKNWFIQELLPNGIMGQQTDYGLWNENYEVVFPFSMNGKQLFYGLSNMGLPDASWFIKLLL